MFDDRDRVDGVWDIGHGRQSGTAPEESRRRFLG
jgi:hypothetical protein